MHNNNPNPTQGLKDSHHPPRPVGSRSQKLVVLFVKGFAGWKRLMEKWVCGCVQEQWEEDGLCKESWGGIKAGVGSRGVT